MLLACERGFLLLNIEKQFTERREAGQTWGRGPPTLTKEPWELRGMEIANIGL